MLGISERTLYYRLSQYRIRLPQANSRETSPAK
jgi:transcriptional regulator of acetoin/glycerol metabolism